jgi:AP-3 complex subunit delta-1
VGRKEGMFPTAGGGGRRVLRAAGWIVGEYARSVYHLWL